MISTTELRAVIIGFTGINARESDMFAITILAAIQVIVGLLKLGKKLIRLVPHRSCSGS